MLRINLLGVKNSDVNLEEEVNDLLQTSQRYRSGSFSFDVSREDPLPFVVTGSMDGREIAFSFDSEEAVLRISAGQEEIEIQSGLDSPDVVQVHYRDQVYDSRHALAESTGMLKPANVYGLLTLALECCGGKDAEMGAARPRKRLTLLTDFGRKKMEEAQAFFGEVVEYVLAMQEGEEQGLIDALESLDIEMAARKPARRKPAAKKAVKKK